MRSIYVASVLAVLGMLVVLVPSPAQGQSATKRTYSVAAMGDSITDLRSPGGGKYLTYLSERCPQSRFDCYGKGGQMVNQMRARFSHDILNDPPTPDKPTYTHVIVFGGVNDIGSDQTAHRTNAKITSDLAAMYDMAKRGGLQVVAITIAPWGGFKKFYNQRRGASTRLVNQWIRDQGRQGAVDFVVDSGRVLSCGDPERLCKPLGLRDGIHLSAQGHRKLADALFSQVFRDCE